MKHLFTLILSVSLFLSISAQTDSYRPMLVEDAFWDIAELDGQSVCNFSSACRYVIAGDTIINNTNYKYFYHYALLNGLDVFCPDQLFG